MVTGLGEVGWTANSQEQSCVGHILKINPIKNKVVIEYQSQNHFSKAAAKLLFLFLKYPHNNSLGFCQIYQQLHYLKKKTRWKWQSPSSLSSDITSIWVCDKFLSYFVIYFMSSIIYFQWLTSHIYCHFIPENITQIWKYMYSDISYINSSHFGYIAKYLSRIMSNAN